MDSFDQLRRMAQQVFKHGEGHEEWRENCAACVLAGVGEYTTEAGRLSPNCAGWARLYVEAGRKIPARYREAFEHTLAADENEAYRRALGQSVEHFGVRFELEPPSTIARELTESFVNGNRKHVRDEIRKLPAKHAAAVAAYVRDYLTDSYDIGYFLRLLSDDC